MDSTTMMIIGFLLVLGVGGYFGYKHLKAKNTEKLFNQVFDTVRQVPKAKKLSFILLMFKETLSPANYKKKSKSNVDKLQNPKYLEIQMIQMSKVLKDKDNVTDKTMKNALKMLNDYLAWEKEKIAKIKEESQKKAA
tara:strand:+ start:410 stop:820 length:411 start_codon:yes stop_codon:yes gene_type:complete